MLKKAVKSGLAVVGLEVRKIPTVASEASPGEQERRALELVLSGVVKAHYGSSRRFLGDGWLNIDLEISDADIEAAAKQGKHAARLDLANRHPFPDGCLSFGFAGDFLEHLDQEQSLRFLIEAHRTLKAGGVLRLSFPGLEGVLEKHYRPATYNAARLAQVDAYERWGHRHFYSRQSLELVARHIGFSNVVFESYGRSQHPELRDLEHRMEQTDLNTYAELVK